MEELQLQNATFAGASSAASHASYASYASYAEYAMYGSSPAAFSTSRRDPSIILWLSRPTDHLRVAAQEPALSLSAVTDPYRELLSGVVRGVRS